MTFNQNRQFHLAMYMRQPFFILECTFWTLNAKFPWMKLAFRLKVLAWRVFQWKFHKFHSVRSHVQNHLNFKHCQIILLFRISNCKTRQFFRCFTTPFIIHKRWVKTFPIDPRRIDKGPAWILLLFLCLFRTFSLCVDIHEHWTSLTWKMNCFSMKSIEF